MISLIKFTLLLTVFLIPLLPATPQFGYQQAVTFGYEQIKVLVFIILISLAAFFWMFEKHKFKWTKISLAGALFILTLFITSALGIDFKTSLLGSPPYFQGLILYAYLFLFYILVSSSKIKMEAWSKVLVGSAVLVSFVAIRDWVALNLLGQSVPLYAGRVVSTFGQPNFYAGFLLLALPFAYRLGKFGLVASLILAVGILVSYSRSAILLLFLLMIWVLLNQIGIKFRYILGLFILTAIIFLGSAIVSLEAKSGAVWMEFVKPSETQWLIDNSPEKRVFIWPIIGKLVMEKPLLGYGLENMSVSFSGFFTKINFNTNSIPFYYSLRNLVVDRSHNYILDLLFFSGISGLSLWISLVIMLFTKLRQNYHGRGKNVLIVSLVTYLIWIQSQNQSIVHLIYFWLLAGLVDQDGT